MLLKKTYNIKLLFFIGTIIGGTGWIFVPFQIKHVSAELSVAYRFLLAGGILTLVSFFKKYPLQHSWKDHFLLASQGVTLFSANYILCYIAAKYICSGLIAASVSTMIIPNIILGRIFLHQKITLKICAAASLGIIGLVFLYWKDFLTFNFSSSGILGLGLCFISTFLAAIGTLIYNALPSKEGSIITANGFAMMYGGVFSLIYAITKGNNGAYFEFSFLYILSMLYISLFVSSILFIRAKKPRGLPRGCSAPQIFLLRCEVCRSGSKATAPTNVSTT